MKIRVYPIEFYQGGGMVLPKNPKLHRKAVKFANEHMGWEQPNFSNYRNVYVACELDENDTPVNIVGLSTMRLVVDIPQMRYLNAKAAKKIIDRMQDRLMDEGVPVGTDVFIRIADGDDPFRCNQYKEWLAAEKAVPAERYVLPTR